MLQHAQELGINATLNMTLPSIKIAINNSEGYEEDFFNNLYETIIANGKREEELQRAEKLLSFETCIRHLYPQDTVHVESSRLKAEDENKQPKQQF
ncbi:hypothetical protein TNCV_5035881 [Trichonephila clavipes]|nr:hypothetical protein TNCV_5035881 [Trichonephila clavipes]